MVLKQCGSVAGTMFNGHNRPLPPLAPRSMVHSKHTRGGGAAQRPFGGWGGGATGGSEQSRGGRDRNSPDTPSRYFVIADLPEAFGRHGRSTIVAKTLSIVTKPCLTPGQNERVGPERVSGPEAHVERELSRGTDSGVMAGAPVSACRSGDDRPLRRLSPCANGNGKASGKLPGSWHGLGRGRVEKVALKPTTCDVHNNNELEPSRPRAARPYVQWRYGEEGSEERLVYCKTMI
ncbi:hypothetical protein DB88DRAFT_472434 [Papiliotrema laurentii]|uniref:Uncharacterized protein n=1 Tax=Papiliotrema laurentii TaxID=5418 RepID=A0AAD9FS29_PAPLA|nr:hypothetical protein DB88DRAFT_472434 [Papiliotrema laurentii]